MTPKPGEIVRCRPHGGRVFRMRVIRTQGDFVQVERPITAFPPVWIGVDQILWTDEQRFAASHPAWPSVKDWAI